jgi:hypothetical protein
VRLLLLVPSVLLLAGCPLPDKADTAAPDAPDDTGGAVDTDPADSGTGVVETGCTDTGLGQLVVIGSFATHAGELVSAEVGYGLYGEGINDWACRVEGQLDYEGPSSVSCPQCDWTFDLSALSHATARGSYCDDFFSPPQLEGYFEYDWGFASTYTYDGGGGYAYERTNVLFLSTGSEWVPIAWDDDVRGDAESIEFNWAPESGYSYYYYCR